MREIKFRIWDKIRKKMIYISGIAFYDKTVIYFDESNNKKEDLLDNIEIMQYSGIKEKNGREIFEADIVEYQRSNKTVRNVAAWKDKQASFGFDYQIIDSWGLSWFEETIPDASQWTIIGNIYENPDYKIR